MRGQNVELSPKPLAAQRNNGFQSRSSPWWQRGPAEPVALALILAMGAYLRLAVLDYAQFRLDDVTLWNIANHIARQPQILSRGIPASVAGLSNGPFQAYLLLPGTLLTSSPLGAYVVVALFNVASILLFWAFVRSYWGSHLGMLAALLYAVNPWAVVFSRRLWGNDLLAPFTVLLIWSLCDLVRHGRRRDSVWPFLWLAIVIQVYVGALTHLALAALGLAFGARRLRLPFLLGGVALFALLTAPYLLGTLAPNVGEVPFMLGSSGEVAQIDLASTSYLFHSVSAEGYQAFANNAGRTLDASSGLPKAVSWLTELLLALGLVAAVADAGRYLRRRQCAAALPVVLVLTAVLLPALLLVRHSAPVFVYYLLIGLPMHFLIVALGIRALWRAMRRLVARHCRAMPALPQIVVGAVVALIVGTHLVLAQVFFGAIGEYWPKSDYGVPMRYTLDLADSVRKLVREEGFGRVYIAGPEKREGVLFRALRPELPDISFFELPDTFVAPDAGAGKALYVLPASEDGIGQAFADRFGGSVLASLEVPGYGLRYSLFSLGAGDLDAVAMLPELTPANSASARLGGFLDLTGYDLPAAVRPGEPLRVTTYWKVLDRPPQDISLWVHLIGGLASQWGQQDGLSYPIELWQPGDRLVLSFLVPVPVGAPPVDYEVEAGGYFRTSGQRLAVERDGGTDDRLRLGSVRVSRPTAPPAPPRMTALDVRFGDWIRLSGYELSARAPAAGDRLRLTLYWESLSSTTVNYTVFTHLVGRDLRPVAQGDGPPAFGAFLTPAWQAGDLVRDVHEIDIPADIQPGRYWLLGGLYVTPNGPRLSPSARPAGPLERLAVWLERRGLYDAGPRVDGDHVVLGGIDVQGKR